MTGETGDHPLTGARRAFSHKINFNFHIFIRPIEAVLYWASSGERERVWPAVLELEISINEASHYTVYNTCIYCTWTFSVCVHVCVLCVHPCESALTVFRPWARYFCRLWLRWLAVRIMRSPHWGTRRSGGSRFNANTSAVLVRREANARRSVSGSSCSTSDPHTHCSSTDLYTPNYTQQPHDCVHSNTPYVRAINTHGGLSKPDRLVFTFGDQRNYLSV